MRRHDICSAKSETIHTGDQGIAGDGDIQSGPYLPGVPVRPTVSRGRSADHNASPKKGKHTAHTAPVVAPATGLLIPTLKICGANSVVNVPRTFVLAGDNTAFANIAEGLLALGVLQESDWNGNLTQSLQRGISRWSHDIFDDDHLPQDNGLLFVFATTGEALFDHRGGGNDGIDSEYSDRPHFAIVWDMLPNEPTDVTVGARVMELEKWMPGAGYQVMSHLDIAMSRSVGAMCPSDAYNHTLEWSERDYDEEEPEPSNTPNDTPFVDGRGWSIEAFEACYPREVLRPFCNRELLAAMFTAPDRNTLPGWMQRALLLTEQIQVLGKPPKENDTTGQFGFKAYPVLVRWSENDFTGAAFDDWHNMHHEDGYLSSILWAYPVKSMGPDPEINCSLGQAVRSLTYCLQVAKLAYELAHTLDESVDEVESAEAPLRMEAIQIEGRVRVHV